MTIDQIRARDTARLATVHPDLRAKVLRILAAMDHLGFPMCVTAGVRTAEEQRALYQKGRERQADGTWKVVGKTVTNADGYATKSNHQAKADGFGHAVDCVFMVDGPDRDGELDTPSWDDSHPWMLYAQMAEALGLVAGGRWKMRDWPHVELKA